MVLLFENGFSGWGQFLQSFYRSTREYVISLVASPLVIWQIHLCSCKSFAKIVPIQKNYKHAKLTKIIWIWSRRLRKSRFHRSLHWDSLHFHDFLNFKVPIEDRKFVTRTVHTFMSVGKLTNFVLILIICLSKIISFRSQQSDQFCSYWVESESWSVLPARMPLPRFHRLATSWMQGTADSRSSRKFLSEAKYNQGWYKRESILFL